MHPDHPWGIVKRNEREDRTKNRSRTERPETGTGDRPGRSPAGRLAVTRPRRACWFANRAVVVKSPYDRNPPPLPVWGISTKRSQAPLGRARAYRGQRPPQNRNDLPSMSLYVRRLLGRVGLVFSAASPTLGSTFEPRSFAHAAGSRVGPADRDEKGIPVVSLSNFNFQMSSW